MLAEQLKNIDLPPMPQVAARVMQIDESKVSVSAEQIKQIIQSDLALSTKILKLANSAFYARGNRITNLAQAIALLGFKTVKGLSLLVSSASIVPKKGNVKVMKELWMRSILTALISKIIAENVGKDKEKDEVFMIGLLRQIGKSIMANLYSEEYGICFQMSMQGTDEQKLHQLETMKWGFTSADVAHFAMTKWNFPEMLTQAALVKCYAIDDANKLEKEHGQVLTVILAEYVVLLAGYTETFVLDSKAKEKMHKEFERIAAVYKIDAAKQKYFLEELKSVIKQDSFYSFCGELFSN